MFTAPDPPRLLARHWLLVLLPPISWALALGSLLALTDPACVRGTRTGLWVGAAIFLALAAAAIPLARRELRALGGDAGNCRARFMMKMALGLGAMFTAVLVLTAVPILLLGTCRT